MIFQIELLASSCDNIMMIGFEKGGGEAAASLEKENLKPSRVVRYLSLRLLLFLLLLHTKKKKKDDHFLLKRPLGAKEFTKPSLTHFPAAQFLLSILLLRRP